MPENVRNVCQIHDLMNQQIISIRSDIQDDIKVVHKRIDKMDAIIEDIGDELKHKAVKDAEVRQMLKGMDEKLNSVNNQLLDVLKDAIKNSQSSTKDEKIFYRKVIIGSLTFIFMVLGAAWGLKQIGVF